MGVAVLGTSRNPTSLNPPAVRQGRGKPGLAVRVRRRLGAHVPLVALSALTGCSTVVMAPSGDVAIQQRDLILVSTGLMLLICVPVIAATLLFAWHYRASNTKAAYEPEWSHSTQLEILIWAAPLVIVIALGAVTWLSTHTLDPYRALKRIDAGRAVAADVAPLQIEVVALDWKWLFIYPELNIASVNELAAPVDRPISFKLTSSTVMNSFSIPALAGQIYTMAGMQTTLHAVINKAGTYEGFSANYSGVGFSRMRFRFAGMAPSDFDAWVGRVRASGKMLDKATYLKLVAPSVADPVAYYAAAEPGLFNAIANLCVAPGKMCASEVMHIDAAAGARGTEHGEHRGHHEAVDRQRLEYDITARSQIPPLASPAKLQIAPHQLNAIPAAGSSPAHSSQHE